MKLKELVTNDNGRLSTTNTIQVMSAITLWVTIILSLFIDRSVTVELGFIIAAMATATATSKGIVTRKDGVKRESVDDGKVIDDHSHSGVAKDE